MVLTALPRVSVDAGRLQELLEESALQHGRLCPRQVLGVRIGLAALAALDLPAGGRERRLLAFAETDGCFVDGVQAATGCSVGHRTLRVHDYGKIAAVFVDVTCGRALRFAPRLDVRERATAYAPADLGHYHAQLTGYQVMPVNELLSMQPVQLHDDLRELLGRAGVRTSCTACGEEIMNGREVLRGDAAFCRPCAGSTYFDLSTEEQQPTGPGAKGPRTEAHSAGA